MQCVYRFSVQDETFLTVRRVQQDIVINVYKPSYKLPIILITIELKLNFLADFSKSHPIEFYENLSSDQCSVI
jgi:hypothetical protein